MGMLDRLKMRASLSGTLTMISIRQDSVAIVPPKA